MIQLFTALLVFSHFNAFLPKPTDFETKTKPQLVQMYNNACKNFFQKPEFQGYDLPGLVNTLIESVAEQPTWLEGRGNTKELIGFYHQICSPTPDPQILDPWDTQMKQALEEYRSLVAQLPLVDDFRTITLPQATDIISGDKKFLADIYIREGRRRIIKIDSLPSYVPKAVVAIEDSRFFDHKGVDEIGILRALMRDAMSNGGRQGASTISQQVARNLFLSPAPTMKRKFQEILIAEKIEAQLSKKEILEIYLNLIFFGRNSWGIEKAAQTYFNKGAKNLTQLEAAFLAGIIHGPNLYRNRPNRIERRTNTVLEKMKEAGIIKADATFNIKKDLKIAPETDLYNSGYVRDFATDQIRKENPNWMNGGTIVTTSIDSKMQEVASQSLQDGLINYERRLGSRAWTGPLDNIADEIEVNKEKIKEAKDLQRMEQQKKKESLFSSLVNKQDIKTDVVDEKDWVTPLSEAASRFVNPVASWRFAVSLTETKIGFTDGSEGFLTQQSLNWAYPERGDVFYVRQAGKFWETVQPPEINGAVVVMTHDGRLLALSGGFSYALSNWNRATQALRQPGSLMKPFTYLTALQMGVQPNTLLSDSPISFPPVAKGGRPWRPVNYGHEFGPPKPMRWGLENSRNVMTAYLMSKIGLDNIRYLTEQMGLYDSASREYPFILGAQETTLLRMSNTFAEIANGGNYCSPRVIDNVLEPNGKQVVVNGNNRGKIPGLDEISLFQIRYLMQGVVARGTAARLGKFSAYMAGKTGTSNESKDVWFIGFTPHIVIGVFVGYDNPQSLGDEMTGGSVALPIFERILTESFKFHYPPEIFPAAPKGVALLPTNRWTGQLVPAMSGNDTVLEAYRESSLTKETK